MHTRDLIRFLAELQENNRRAWFVMNKPRYDILRAEFLVLVSELIEDVARFDPAVADCNPRKALFRINRDMRFSKDKQPYKTNFSAAITASGLKKPSQGGGPAYYFHIDANGILLIAAGEYLPPSPRLAALRRHIVNDAQGFAKLLKNKKLNEVFGGFSEEDKLTRPPKGYDADTVHLDYVKLKSLILVKEIDLTKSMPDNLRKTLAADFKAAYPLVSWLREARN
jgi:uncharacterized protein (TIGR02453 family)